MDAKCTCQVCGEHLDFPEASAGQSVNCPHCQCDTMLSIQPEQPAAVVDYKDKSVPVADRIASYKAHLEATKGQREADLAEIKRHTQPLNTKCPHCGSESTIKCSVAYQSGTSRGSFSGIGMDLAGDIGGFGGVKTSQTAFAASLAPPKIQSTTQPQWLMGLIVGGLAAILGFGYLVDDDTKVKWPCIVAILCGIVTAIASAIKLAADHNEVKKQATIAMMKWMNEWVCTRCGSRFDPNPK